MTDYNTERLNTLIKLRQEIQAKIDEITINTNFPTETLKAKQRRLKENFFELYCKGKGIDIGCGIDPILPNAYCYDKVIDQVFDATYVKEIEDESFDFVYSSHCLEDLEDPATAIKNWWRIVKPSGFLIIYVPHRDLFERKKNLPSAGNQNHKWYFLIDRDEPPVTLGLVPLVSKNLTNYDIIYVKKCDTNYTRRIENLENNMYRIIATGEFSIEMVIQKYPNNTSY